MTSRSEREGVMTHSRLKKKKLKMYNVHISHFTNIGPPFLSKGDQFSYPGIIICEMKISAQTHSLLNQMGINIVRDNFFAPLTQMNLILRQNFLIH